MNTYNNIQCGHWLFSNSKKISHSMHINDKCISFMVCCSTWCAVYSICKQLILFQTTCYKKRAITLLPLVDSEQYCTKAGKTLQKVIKLRDFVWWYFNASWLILIFESRALFPSHICLFISLFLIASLFISLNELLIPNRA